MTKEEFHEETNTVSQKLAQFMLEMAGQKISLAATVAALSAITCGAIAGSMSVDVPDEYFAEYAHEVISGMEEKIFKERERFKEFSTRISADQISNLVEELIKAQELRS